MAASGGRGKPFDDKENLKRKRPFQEDEDFVMEEDFDLEPPEDDLEDDMQGGLLVRLPRGKPGMLLQGWPGRLAGHTLLLACNCRWTRVSWGRPARTGRGLSHPRWTLPGTP